ncbi:hypothetical protein M0E87_05730 [Corynebacterium sp. CCM 9185]|uniref:Secreted protein n=1 Tax=Corynebacterium marambiense TaxID=2765364 RepID=A0ABS0VY96_9CORY|nr:hypothetical protein [Corynebacterium marambiense]MBI9000575.1 hypothetical protein [Corynebacterium marambiense]MCK7663162.1 hypothetical protein [Corynebacterium marambiense]MCX7542776.1 hypothetical protein [Corynebacterium marambiense]
MKLFSRSTAIAAATTFALAASSLTVPAWADDAPSSSQISGKTDSGSSDADKADGTNGDSDSKDDGTAKDSDPIADALRGSSDNSLSSGIGSSDETVYQNLDGDEVTGPKIAMVFTKIMQLIKTVVGIVSLISAAASLIELAKKYMPR